MRGNAEAAPSRNPPKMPTNQKYSESELIEYVRRVCIEARPDDPTRTSGREFDQTRKSAHLRGPSAARVADRLAYHWPDLLALVFDDRRNPIMSVMSRQRNRRVEGNPGFDRCAEAVRTVAQMLGQRYITLNDYEEARAEALASCRGSNRIQLAQRLPLRNQVRAFDWKELVEAAGLEYTDRRQLRDGIPAIDAMERHLMLRGYLPNHRELFAFAKAEGFAVKKPTKSIKGCYVELHFRNKERGRYSPEDRPRRSSQIPGEIPEIGDSIRRQIGLSEIGQSPERRYQPRQRWTLELVEQGLDEALLRLPAGQNLSASRLRQLASKWPGTIPSQTIVHRYAKEVGKTFSQLRDEAVARSLRSGRSSKT